MTDEIPLHRTCATREVHERLLETNPTYRANRLALARSTNAYMRRAMAFGLEKISAVIPVVVHLVYGNENQNISDEQIQSQIDILNQDFRKLNSDVSLVPSQFQSLVADTGINFKLATEDPDKNPTNGIIRTSTKNSGGFTQDDAVKFASSGGHDAWPSDMYLNLWVCKLNGGLLGYAQFPGGPAETDGVVINYQAFGNIGTATPPFNKGRSATHEIGHWLNLHHIWGDNWCGDDQIEDTPKQEAPNYGCPSFPHVTCNNGPNGDIFMNYMDYVDDGCMNMFTLGQVARIMAALEGPRSSFITQS